MDVLFFNFKILYIPLAIQNGSVPNARVNFFLSMNVRQFQG